MNTTCPLKGLLAPALTGALIIAPPARAQSEPIFLTVPASTVGVHLEFANLEGTGGSTRFNLFGAATHADWSPPDPPALHTLLIVFEWRIAPGPDHTFDNWGQSSDYITTVVGGMTNTFSTGFVTVPGAWDTVAVHLYAGFPITVSATFDHRWVVPSPAPLGLMGLSALLTARRRR
jgi:hypothetical protein